MIQSQYVLKSRKKLGKYEKVIIEKLSKYFSLNGFDVIPHARFDLAWGSILSDVDLLLIKNNKLILVEVKSSKDNLERARDQINRIEEFVDFIYLATDYKPKKWPSNKVGKILVINENITIVKEAKLIHKNLQINTLMKLKRSSLENLLKDSANMKNQSKHELALKIIKKKNKNLKEKVKEIITCQNSSHMIKNSCK